MLLKTTLYGKTYEFKSVKEVLAKANEEKSGDILAGVAAADAKERIAAKAVLAGLTVHEVTENPCAPYESDAVTRIILDGLDACQYALIKGKTIAEVRDKILDSTVPGDEILRMAQGMSSEVIAAAAKLMGNLDLIYGSKKLRIKSRCNTELGIEGCFASRLQPNHPADNANGVMASLFEGLSYGSGDALIGLNPATDSVDSTAEILSLFDFVKNKYEIPTQGCVLSHVLTQMKAVESGAPADLCFQSIAGSEKALASFGVSVGMLEIAQSLFREKGTAKGENVMYFETGQASELSSDSHWGADQQTMESRCYGLARHFKPFLVNSVVGFMGPEYLYDGRQVIRAGLEDCFCAKLHGLPMGCDVCYTNHMMSDQNDMDNLLILLASAGCSYVMGLPCGDDIMLMYQSTSFHDVAAAREILGLSPLPEFRRWLEKYGIWENGRLSKKAGDPSLFFREGRVLGI